MLSEPRFDASKLDPARFTLGDWRDDDVRVARDAKGVPLAARLDVDRDGDVDLLLSFDQTELERTRELTSRTRQLVLAADLGEGNGIYAVNGVKVIVK